MSREFRIGDRVRGVGEMCEININGMTGTIIFIGRSYVKSVQDVSPIHVRYGIRFNTFKPQFHDCDNLCKEHYGRYVDARDIRLAGTANIERYYKLVDKT